MSDEAGAQGDPRWRAAEIERIRREMPMDLGELIPPPLGTKPHQFVGRHDRWCESCNLPDRHPIHKTAT